MGKGKQKTQSQIRQFIYDDYIFNRELESVSDILKHMELLVDNNLASRISGKEDVSYTRVSKYKIASKMLCDIDKSLREHIRQPLDHEYNVDHIDSKENPKLVELAKEGLDIGVYYVDLGDEDHDDYAVFRVQLPDDEDPYIISYDLYFIGYRHNKFKKKFLKKYDKFKKMNDEKKDEAIVDISGSFEFKSAQFKSFNNMIFTGKNEILQYIDNWVENIPYYDKYEITPKLSILLYGEPGTGKSTFCRALAKYLGIENVGVITSAYFTSSNDNSNRRRPRYGSYMSMVYSLDDIDCICRSREEDTSNENAQVLASLLEFLDNPPTFDFKAKDGKYYPVSIVVASTNYFDRLDDAVKRYGRFDYKLEMKPLTVNQAREMCALYDLELESVYKDKITNDTLISPAYLQALCMENVDKAIKKKGE